MYILGISCFYHDSAAVLIKDGVISGAAQEERFTRKKHDSSFPVNSINWCLREAGITAADLDHVVFYDKPFIKFERILETQLSYSPSGISQFLQAVPLWLKQKLWIPEIIAKELNYKGKVLFVTHHEAHAASAFYPSPFQEAAFLTMDGVGEWDTTSFGIGKDNDMDFNSVIRFPHSLGLLYSAFTYYCGFRVNSGEYKLMGLAPYGEPKYVDLILKELIDLKDDGSFKLNMKYFGYCNGLRMTNRKFDRLFEGLARKPETPITRKHMDIAASIQKVTEEAVLRICRHARKVTGKDKLCLAGGVALNCVANGRILRETDFKDIWIQPASGDAGGALGAALLVWHKYAGNKRVADGQNDRMRNSLLGPAYTDEYIEGFLSRENIAHTRYSAADMPGAVAELIAQGNVIGWFQGKMEFGPRALGSRSIIGDARNPQMQSRMNLKIKFRESFRPFAPAVLAEHMQEWFELEKRSPYMLLTAQVKPEKRVGPVESGDVGQGLEALKTARSQIPAVTHVDHSARVQSVERRHQPLFYDTIKAFYDKTGCPVIINTSFNVRGEPLVCAPDDAFRCFMRTEMDYLVMGGFILDKRGQKPGAKDTPWQNEFQLD